MRQAEALAILQSGASVFLTGAPGAGKTYVLNEFVRQARAEGAAGVGDGSPPVSQATAYQRRPFIHGAVSDLPTRSPTI